MKVTSRHSGLASKLLNQSTFIQPPSSSFFHRVYNSAINSKIRNKRRITSLPKATWSISELKLKTPPPPSTITSSNENNTSVSSFSENSIGINDLHSRITDEELDKLAYRCLINVYNLAPPSAPPSTNQYLLNRLKTDLQNIMRCVSILTNDTSDSKNNASDKTHATSNETLNEDEDWEKDILGDLNESGGCPVRSRAQEMEGWNDDCLEKKEAKDILDRLKESKMVQKRMEGKGEDGCNKNDSVLDGWYFSPATNVEKEDRSDAGNEKHQL